MTKVPYNKGDAYEANIFKMLESLGLIPEGTKRAGAGAGADMPFLHNGKIFNLEVKKDLQADFGQKYFKWNKNNGWSWALNDQVTNFYTQLGVLTILNNKSIIPNKLNKPDKQITIKDKKEDQKNFEDKIDVPIQALYEYYKSKKCFYIQIGKGFGFYHLEKDIANLGTPQFNAEIKLRFRAKTIHSEPVYNYRFLVAIKIKLKTDKSCFNLETTNTQRFPPIKP